MKNVVLLLSVFVSTNVEAQRTIPDLVYSTSPAVLNIEIQDYDNYLNSLDSEDLRDAVVVNYKNGLTEEDYSDSIKLSDSGTATISLPLCYSKIVTLFFADNVSQFLLVPGRTVNISLDTSKNTSEEPPVWKCSGDNSRLNFDLSNYGPDYDEISMFAYLMWLSPDKLKKMDAAAYKKIVLSIYERGVKTIASDKRLSALYKDFLGSRFQLQGIGMLAQCKQSLARAKGISADDVKLPPNFWDVLDLWKPFDSNGVLYSSYMPELTNLAVMVSSAADQTIELPWSFMQLSNAQKFVNQILKGQKLTKEEKEALHGACPDLEIAILDLESKEIK